MPLVHQYLSAPSCVLFMEQKCASWSHHSGSLSPGAAGCFGGLSGRFSAGLVWPRWQVVQLIIGVSLLRFLIFFRYSLLMAAAIVTMSRAICFVGLSSFSQPPTT